MLTRARTKALTATLFKDVLHNNGVASVIIHLLKPEDKRNLRLVCHAGKDAVDSTVTYVCMPGLFSKIGYKIGVDYACIVSNSNWKNIKQLEYSTFQRTYSREYMEPHGLTRIAEAGLSKLESLMLRLSEHEGKDRKTADKLIRAGWKLKKLHILAPPPPSECLGAIMRDANWPLEELSIRECTDSIASLIAVSEWKLKTLRFIHLSSLILSPEGVETLMQGSWVSTVERLRLDFKHDHDKKGIRAISQASHRAVNLLDLQIYTLGFNNRHALILGEGSYPNLKVLLTYYSIHVSGIAAILRKCPKLEVFKHGAWSSPDAYHVDDPEDAKLVAEYYKNGILKVASLDLDLFKTNLADYL